MNRQEGTAYFLNVKIVLLVYRQLCLEEYKAGIGDATERFMLTCCFVYIEVKK